MIDKIRADIVRRITDNTFGAKLELMDILSFLDTLEEPVSDCHDLEEAADEWCKTNNKGIALCADKKSHYLAEGIDAFKAGAEWQKVKMMEGATYNELMELYMAIRDEIIKRHRDAAVNIKEKTMDLKEDTGNESALHQIRG